MKHSRLKKQSGIIYLMGAMLGVTAATVQLANSIEYDQVEMLDKEAQITGNQLAQYNNAVRIFVGENASSSTPSAKTGVNWLKDPSCGGPSSNPAGGFLPCGFPTQTSLGQTYRTTFTKTGGVLAASTTISKPVLVGLKGYEAVLASKISATASATPGNISGVGADTFYDYSANPSVNIASSNASANPNFGTVRSTASTNPAFGAWLRTDGSNAMKADIDMNGHSLIDVARMEMRRTDGVYPYLDFSNDPTSDYDARLYLAGNDTLAVAGAELYSGNIRSTTSTATNHNSTYANAYSSNTTYDAATISTVRNRLYAENITLTGNTALGYSRSNSDLESILRTIENRLPRYAHKETHLAGHGWWIRKPSCPGGTPKAIAIPVYWDMRADEGRTGYNRHTQEYRSTTNFLRNIHPYYWQANAYSRVYDGYNYRHNPGQVLVNTYCYY